MHRMRSLRTTWRLRGLTVLLAVSLLPMTVVLPSSAALPQASDAPADWLRKHIQAASAEDEGAVEAALDAATDAPAATLQDFLRAFAHAYQQHAPDRPIGYLFGTPGLSGDALIHYLQRHVPQLSGWATVAPRLTAAAATAGSTAPPRALGTPVAQPCAARTALGQGQPVRPRLPQVICSVRTLFSARPLGP